MPARIVSSARGNEPHGAGGRSSPGVALHKGQPEETFTRHQPISIPSRPRRGRECQWPQPGSPTSAREIRSHLKLGGRRRACRSSSSRLRGLELGAPASACAASAIRVGEARRAPARAHRGRGPAARARRPRPAVSISSRGKASATRRESWCSRRPIWRRSSARASRSSPSTRSGSGVPLYKQIRHPDNECKSPRRSRKSTLRLRAAQGSISPAAIQSASSTAICGTPLTWIATIVSRR